MVNIIIYLLTNTLEVRFTDDPVCPICDEFMEERDDFDPIDTEEFEPGDWICWDCGTSTTIKNTEE